MPGRDAPHPAGRDVTVQGPDDQVTGQGGLGGELEAYITPAARTHGVLAPRLGRYRARLRNVDPTSGVDQAAGHLAVLDPDGGCRCTAAAPRSAIRAQQGRDHPPAAGGLGGPRAARGSKSPPASHGPTRPAATASSVDHAEVSSPAPHEGREADRVLQEDPEQRFVGVRDLTRWPTAPGAALARAALRLRERLAPHSMLLVILLVGFAVVAVLTVLAGLVYDSVSEKDGVAGLDRPALSAAMAVRTPLGNTLARAYTDIGGATGMPILATLVAVGLALTWRQWTPVLLVAATAIGSITLTVVGKAVVGRIRPPLADAVPPYEHSASFPSGHALNSIALAGIVAYLLVRRQHGRLARLLTLTVAAAFAFTMGMSRVYLGHHWFTDVLVAWALGLAWLTAVITAHRLLLTVRARDRPGAVENEPLDREPDGGHTPS